MSTIRELSRRVFGKTMAVVPESVMRNLRGVPALRRAKDWLDGQSEPLPPEPEEAEPVGRAHVEEPEDEQPEDEQPAEVIGDRPSYRYKLEEFKRRRQLILAEYELRDPLYVINDKYRAYEFADTHDVDHPQVFQVYESIDEVEWDQMPDAFVLKTRWGSSNIGVKALVAQGDDAYKDLLRTQHLTRSEIEDDLREKADRGVVARGIFAEELILKPGRDEIADDWKFYCFDGRVGLVMQRDLKGSPSHSDWRFKFWDRDWADMGPIKFVDRLDPDLTRPADPHGLTALAERLSTIIGRAFIRIDLFESERGPLLGEFTPSPGPPEIFTPEVDAMLGEMWEQAEARQFAREIQQGGWKVVED